MSDGLKPPLGEVARAAFASLAQRKQATRKMVAEDAGISLPTVTAALAELMAAGLIEELRREQGPRGRATLVYGLAPTAGLVLSTDIGSTQIIILLRGLGEEEFERVAIRHDGSPQAAASLAGEEALAILNRHRSRAPILAIALSLNQIVPRAFGPGQDDTVTSAMVRAFTAALKPPASLPILVENNVNCAALAEHDHGLMRDIRDAAYMQVGTGIGVGFFSDGRLIRGGHGASGEIAQVPLAWDGATPSPRNAIELEYGSVGLYKRLDAIGPDCAALVRQSMSMGGDGTCPDSRARAVLSQHGIALGRLAAAAATLLDPAMLVVGGSLSRNRTIMEAMAHEFGSRNACTAIHVSALGPDSSADGAAFIAKEHTFRTLAGKYYRTAIAQPTLWPNGA